MAFPSINPTATQAWQNLREHFFEIQHIPMQEMFLKDEKRAEKFHIEWDKFLVDFSKNRINETTLKLLLDLVYDFI